MNNQNQKWERMKWLAILVLASSLVLIAILGNLIGPRILGTNLQSEIDLKNTKQINVQFSKVMDRRSVENAWRLEPKVAGHFVWSGRGVDYVFDQIPSLGTNYVLEIGSKAVSVDGKVLSPYKLQFKTKPLKFTYLAKDGLNVGKIVEINGFSKTERVYTDGSYEISNYQFSADQRYLYFLAKNSKQKVNEGQLFRMDLNNNQILQITKDQNYLNKNFTLSDDGKMLSLNRIELAADGTYKSRIEVWLARTDTLKLEKYLNGQAQGADSRFSPGGAYLLYRNGDGNFQLSETDKLLVKKGQGQSDEEENLYIGEFSSNFGFHPFLPKIAFTEYDQQDVFSLNNNLVLFSGDGEKKTLDLKEKGIVRDVVFHPNGKNLIYLFSPDSGILGSGEETVRIFHLYNLDMETGEIKQLTKDSDYFEFAPSISGDGRYLLFQSALVNEENMSDPAFMGLNEDLNGKQVDSQLYLLDLQSGEISNLKIKGNLAAFKN